MNGFALVKSEPARHVLNAFDDNIALSITFLDDFGPVLIWGRLVIKNNDTDPQSAAAWLVWQRDVDGQPPKELDRTEVRLDNGGDAGQMSLSLQGWTTVKNGHVIELHCSTWKGERKDASLMALGIVEWRVSP